MKDLPKWLSDAISRINAERQTIVLDTQEKVDQYNNQNYDDYAPTNRKLVLGDTITVRSIQKVVPDAQRMLDDFMAREYLRNV